MKEALSDKNRVQVDDYLFPQETKDILNNRDNLGSIVDRAMDRKATIESDIPAMVRHTTKIKEPYKKSAKKAGQVSGTVRKKNSEQMKERCIAAFEKKKKQHPKFSDNSIARLVQNELSLSGSEDKNIPSTKTIIRYNSHS